MKTMISLRSLRVTGLVLGLSASLAILAGANAATTNTGKVATVGKHRAVAGAVAGTPAGGANEVGLLDQAYGLLRTADHDYHGHRARAMHQIEDAVKELGSHVTGSGKGDEKQAESDTQLRNAQSLLQQAVGGLAGKPHRHIEDAIKQLGIALTIK